MIYIKAKLNGQEVEVAIPSLASLYEENWECPYSIDYPLIGNIKVGTCRISELTDIEEA